MVFYILKPQSFIVNQKIILRNLKKRLDYIKIMD